ncbi:MAG TPA: site-specific DNA-methyltransferase [bacterium]|nr:site-specific DNA-methyltransferase [bacterium]
MAELIWDGKYQDGKKVSPVKIALPFQTIETINESTQDRQQSLDMFSSGQNTGWKNRLIWGDKKYVLPSLMGEFSGKIDLIYIDPPFNVGADFSFMATVPDDNENEEGETQFIKEPNLIEMKAYRDTWGKGVDSYVKWFGESLYGMNDLLSDTGSIYVHLDYHVVHYVKIIMDEIFGKDNFVNEIIWKRSLPHNDPKRYGSTHDTILFYSKTDKYKFNQQYTGLTDSYIKSHYNQKDENGRAFQLTSLAASGVGPPRKFGDKILTPPKGNHWRYSQENIDLLLKEGRIVFTSTGNPRYKRYMDEMKGPALQSIWDDVLPVNSQAAERVSYATQKPEALLERIIKASSNEGDLVADFFCGSGTTLATAEKLKRKWIGCDLGRFAIHTTRKRLLSISGIRPFVLQNLGKYERQAWQAAEFSEPKKQVEKELNYRRFILDLYKAEPITGFAWLHGTKKDRMIHVGVVDAPITLADVKAIAAETWKSVGKGKNSPAKATVDILGWDFALEVNEVAKQIAAESGVEVHFKIIPREVLDKKAVDQGDIKFFELSSLAVEIKSDELEATARLKDFVIVPEYVPEDVQKAIRHWAQWIDYWAVDWDYKNDTFHNQWQSYRSRQNPELELNTAHSYEAPGEYSVVVKVIDILGNDTTKLVKIKVLNAKKKK